MSADQDGSVGKDGGWAATEGPQASTGAEHGSQQLQEQITRHWLLIS